MDIRLVFGTALCAFLNHVAEYFAEVDDDVDFVLGGGVILDFSELRCRHIECFLFDEHFRNIHAL